VLTQMGRIQSGSSKIKSVRDQLVDGLAAVVGPTERVGTSSPRTSVRGRSGSRCWARLGLRFVCYMSTPGTVLINGT
jgi:hypothetical protein